MLSEEKQRIAENAHWSTRLSATMTPFALSRLMPLPFWPVPPESARIALTRLPRTIEPSSPSSSRETRMPVSPQLVTTLPLTVMPSDWRR